MTPRHEKQQQRMIPFVYPPFSYEGEPDTMSNYLFHLQEFRELASDQKKQDKQFLNHQKLIARFISPYTDGNTRYQNLLVIHDVGTGKSGIVCCVFEEYYKFFKKEFNFIYLSNNDVTKNNFIEEFLKLSPVFQKVHEKLDKRKFDSQRIYITKYSNTDLTRLQEKIKKNNHLETIIFVDEVHNIVNRDCIKEQEEEEDTRHKIERIRRFLNQFPKKRTLFLTGTPIRHAVDEIIPIFSLLSEKEHFSYDLFEKKQWKMKLREILKTMNISYFRKKKQEDIEVVYEKGDEDLQDLNESMFHAVFFQKMSSFQSERYLYNLFEVDPGKKSTMDNRFLHRHAVIVEEKLFLSKLQKTNGIEEKLQLLHEHSIIFHSIMKQILQEPEKKKFIYCKYIQHAGINVLVKILESFGQDFIRLSCEAQCPLCHVKVRDCQCKDSSKKSFGLNTKQLVQKFNSSEKIKIIIGSDNQSEGISFLNIEQIHIVSPWWNYGRVKQAIGRGIRYRSHEGLVQQKRIHALNESLSSQFERDSSTSSYLLFLENKYQEIALHNDDNTMKKDNTFFLKEILERHPDYCDQFPAGKITVQVFLHCAIPDRKEYEQRLQSKTEDPSGYDIIQLKHYQNSTKQEKKIEEVMYEIYKHSIDYQLNFSNNQILEKDPYFKHIPVENMSLTVKPEDQRNYNHLYLEEKSQRILSRLESMLEKIFTKTGTSQSFPFILKTITKKIKHASTELIAHSLLTLLSKNTFFVIEDKKFFLRYQNNFLFLSPEKNAKKYIQDQNMKLPPYHLFSSSIRKKNDQVYDLESIKEHFNVKKKLKTLPWSPNSLRKRKLSPSTWNTIQTLPKKVRYEMGFSLSSTKQIVNNKKEDKLKVLSEISNDPKFIELQHSLKKNMIGIRMKKDDEFYIYFLNETKFLLESTLLEELQQKLFRIISLTFKNQMDKVLKIHYKNFGPDQTLSWEIKYQIIQRTMKEYEKLKKNNHFSLCKTKQMYQFSLFEMNWEQALGEIKKFLSRKEFINKKGLKKIFQIDSNTISSNFLKESRLKWNGIEIYTPNQYQYIIWVNLQIINYNLKLFHFQNNPKCIHEWELFYRTFLTDRRLDSSGRNIHTIHTPELYNIFVEYLTDEEKKGEIENELVSYQNNLKKINNQKWRLLLINILEARKQIWEKN